MEKQRGEKSIIGYIILFCCFREIWPPNSLYRCSNLATAQRNWKRKQKIFFEGQPNADVYYILALFIMM